MKKLKIFENKSLSKNKAKSLKRFVNESLGKRLKLKSGKIFENVESVTEEVKNYFEFYDIEMSGSFNIEEMSEKTKLTVVELECFLCNLEDDKVMKDIASGNYESFDPWDSNQFNDGYYDVLDDLGYGEDEDDDEYEDVNEDENNGKKPVAGGKIEIEGDVYDVVAYFDNIDAAKKYEKSIDYKKSYAYEDNKGTYEDNKGYSATDGVESDHYCYIKTEDGGVAFTDLDEIYWEVK